MSLLEARHLDFVYRTGGRPVDILKDVCFTVEEGDYVAIQGPSGSGKSTLFYILGCLLKPTGGAALFKGQDLGRLTDDQAALVRNREIGFVFQQFHLLPRATVLDNILMPKAYPAELRRTTSAGADRERALALAQRLGLSEHLKHLPNQLSGGQQQRVAIARALIGDVSLVLADEPTGNLDSKNAQAILDIFDELNAQGKTIVVITHDSEVAKRCKKVFHVRDGVLSAAQASGETVDGPQRPTGAHQQTPAKWSSSNARLALLCLPSALGNLVRNRLKSLLTMLGIVIGIAAVLAMITLGQFTKRRILEGFEALGVNKLNVQGYPSRDRKATDEKAVPFIAFDYDTDLKPLKRFIPEVGLLSPVLMNWQNTVTAGGKSVQENIRLLGVNHEYFQVANAHIAEGRPFDPYHVELRASVCILGHDVAEQVFGQAKALDQMVTIAIGEERSFPCRIIGVLAPQKSNQEWFQPNLQVLVPYTALQAAGDWWSSKIHSFAVQVRPESDVEVTAKKLKAYFDLKYGKGGNFSVGTDGTLVAQMKRFLNIFAALLASIAFLSLLVGGIGINNMMLVSVTERIKEIGLRKALGATGRSIRVQILMESVVLCALAGLTGIAAGFATTELLIWAATKLVPNLKFEWVIDPGALVVSVGSIAAVGILSGMIPALRAERLQVIEALRAE